MIFSKLFKLAPDEEYFNDKATEARYLSKLSSGDFKPDHTLMELSLQERARVLAGGYSYDELLQGFDVDPSFVSLSNADIMFATGAGFMGVMAAHYTNANSESLQKFFENIHSKYKADSGPSPLDYRTGKGHRYIFGHDLNIFQKLPPGYTINGVEVGGKTLYTLVLEQMKAESAGLLGPHLKAIMHIFTHYLSDLPTKDGLPLPFSSLFTRWVEDPTKASGFSAKNPLMDVLGREYGTIHMADISSYAIIKLVVKSHNMIAFHKRSATQDEKSLHLAQISTIAYGTGIIVQMLMLLYGFGGRTGKLNYLIALPFLWNAGKSVLILNKQNREIIRDYDHSIAMLDERSVTFDEWVKSQCS